MEMPCMNLSSGVAGRYAQGLAVALTRHGNNVMVPGKGLQTTPLPPSPCLERPTHAGGDAPGQ